MQDDGFPILKVGKPDWWRSNMRARGRTDGARGCRRGGEISDDKGSFGYVGEPGGAAHMDNPVTSYSGGGKMEMHLTAAKLLNADVLMH